MEKLPVIVISGFHGAGKTSLLSHILKIKGDLNVAVILNELSEVNLDAEMLRNGKLNRAKDHLIELNNGSICSNLHMDLVNEIESLANKGKHDYLIIESSGVSKPLPVAQALCYPSDEYKIDLTGTCRLDTLVTIVDAYNFLKDYCNKELLKVISPQVIKDENPALANLLNAQIRFANVIVINKAGLVSASHLTLIKVMIRKLNAEAIVLEANYGEVDLRYLLNTNLFEFNRITQNEEWINELSKFNATPSKQEYGLSYFVYRSLIPFHKERLYDFINAGWPDNIIRIKGIFWLASCPEKVYNWNQAGGIFYTEKAGVWWCTMPIEKRLRFNAYVDNQKQIEKNWNKEFGDRHIELVIIGQNLNKGVITSQLNACLCTAIELNNMEWKFGFPFPFDEIKKIQLN